MNSKKLQIFLKICFILLLANPVFAEKIKDYGNTKQLYQILKTKLSWHNRREYFGFRTLRGISVFVVDFSENDNSWTYTTSYQNLGTAKRMALAYCRHQEPNTKKRKTDCQIYAIIIPKGMDINDDKSLVLSADAKYVYRKEYLKKHKAGSFSAFAIANTAAYGYSTQQSSKKQAEKMAVLFCKSREIKDWSVLKKSEACRTVNILGPK